MASKDITIKIAATGAPQAAGEIGKVGEKISEVARAAKAQAISDLADKAGILGKKFADAADEVEEFDKDAAASLRNIGRGIEQVSQSISVVAAGFAAGGPLGSALAAAGVMVQALTNKFAEGEIAALQAAASEKQAMAEVEAATRNAANAAQERATALASAGVVQTLNAELEAAQALSAELERQLRLTREKRALDNEKLDAKDRTALAEVDADLAGGKIGEDEAARRREEIEAAATKRSLNERKQRAIEDSVSAGEDALQKTQTAAKARSSAGELGLKRDAAVQNADQLAAYVEGELGKMVRDPDTGELSESDKKFTAEMEAELAKARNLVKILEDATQKAEELASKSEGDAAAARQEAQDKEVLATRTVETVSVLEKESARRDSLRGRVRTFNAEKKKRDQQKDRIDREQKATDLIDREGSGIANAAADAAEEAGVRGGIVSGLRKIAGDIAQPGNTAADEKALERILSMVQTIVDHMDKRGDGGRPSKSKFGNIEQRLDTVERQVKNWRTGK